MNLEGLNAILTKEEVVATQTADALLNRPREVDDAYKAHVRTYVPLHTGRGEGRLSVKEFSRRLVCQVKEKLAPRGYLTADFGYGKTSTALYLWSQAQQANLVAVPPFQLTRLPSLIVATYGWMNYVLSHSRPSLCDEAKAIYDAFAERSLEQMAAESNADLDTLRRWLHDGRLTLDLTAPDYIHFFEKMTALAHRAGFGGLLVLADEIQQYIEPEVKSGAKDPIAPLFNVVQGLATRRKHLAFGLILIIPRKELSVIVDQRGDFVDRMRGLALDLGAIYDQSFPKRLWDRLAKEFQFAEHTEAMVRPETLTALGQISVRDDLSNGPRTVVNTFRRIARRYLEQPDASPYSSVDLVDDFLGGAIRFDGVKRLQEVTTRALGHSLVRDHPDREQAVKLAAAFPEEGATRKVQGKLAPAFDDLFQSGGGELVIRVGDVREPGFTLLGLERGEVKTDWLTLTVREFSRTYYESAEKTTQRAVEGFLDLLTSHVFRPGQWKVGERLKSRMTQNAGLVLEGAFPSAARRFPDRRVHVRVLMEDEPVKDANPLGEVVLEIQLCRYLDWDEETRRYHVEPVEFDLEAHTARFTLNLMSRSVEVSRELDEAIGKIVSPFKLTPLLLLTLHEVLNEKRRARQIPKADDQLIEYQFQPALLDNALVELLRPEVGAAFDAARVRLVETVVGELLKARYGDDYHTLMAVGNWQSSIQKYINALHRLDSLPEKQGQMNVEGLKEDIADLFPLSHTGLDSLMANFSNLIKQVRDFPTRRQAEEGATGAVRFQLHPLETQIRAWLKASPDTTTVKSRGKTHTLHRLPIGQVYTQAAELGYKDDEVDVLLEVMEARALIERDQRGNLREALRQVPSVDEVADAVSELQSSIGYLQTAFPQAKEFQRLAEETEKYIAKVEELRETADEKTLVSLRRTVTTRLRDVRTAAEGRQAELHQEVGGLLRRLPGLDARRRNTLETQVTGVKYTDQVNNLRIRLLREHTRFSNQVDELRRRLEAIEYALANEELALSDLAKQATALRDLEQDVTAIHKSSETLDEQYHQFTEWSRLVEDGARLFDDLQVLGDPATDLMTTFDRLSRDIRGDISAHALDALPNVTTYTSRLNELRGQARRLRDQAVEAFNDLQNRYRDELVRTIGYPRDRLWERLIYSTLDPVGIYQQLYGHVARALADVVDRMQRLQSTHLSGVRNLLNTPRLADLPSRDRKRIEKRGHELETHLSQVGDVLAQVQERAVDLDAIRDFPAESDGGGFRVLLSDLKALYDQLDSARQGLDTITTVLRQQALSPEETQVWKVLGKISPADGFADLTVVRAEAHKIDDEALWSALRGLWEKQRAQVQVRLVRYNEE
jgi:hypothetical protein